MAAGTEYHKVMANDKTSEFANFGKAMGTLSGPHSEIKAKFEAEEWEKATKKIPESAGRGSS